MFEVLVMKTITIYKRLFPNFIVLRNGGLGVSLPALLAVYSTLLQELRRSNVKVALKFKLFVIFAQ